MTRSVATSTDPSGVEATKFALEYTVAPAGVATDAFNTDMLVTATEVPRPTCTSSGTVASRGSTDSPDDPTATGDTSLLRTIGNGDGGGIDSSTTTNGMSAELVGVSWSIAVTDSAPGSVTTPFLHPTTATDMLFAAMPTACTTPVDPSPTGCTAWTTVPP